MKISKEGDRTKWHLNAWTRWDSTATKTSNDKQNEANSVFYSHKRKSIVENDVREQFTPLWHLHKLKYSWCLDKFTDFAKIIPVPM